MKNTNRKLLLSIKYTNINPHKMEKEIHDLNTLLEQIECFPYFYIAHEMLDLRRYRIIKDFVMIKHLTSTKTLMPFIFIINKN